LCSRLSAVARARGPLGPSSRLLRPAKLRTGRGGRRPMRRAMPPERVVQPTT
jgi:hypothetical protein